MSNTDKTTKEECKQDLFSRIKALISYGKNENNLREKLEDYLEEIDENSSEMVSVQECDLISNVLQLRDMTALNVMIPRADIVSIEAGITEQELLKLLSEKQFSRFPVYKETLDDIIGIIHIKDIIAQLAANKPINVKRLVRDVPIVSPAMPVLNLLLDMRQSRKQMMLVVDEFGGIDGLVAIGDIIEAIVGELEDEFDSEVQLSIEPMPDGSLTVDARYDINDFEQEYGIFLSNEEKEDIETLGGLVFYMAGRIPARGEVLTHECGMVFEIVDADPRRVKTLRIKNIPQNNNPENE